MAWLDRLRQWWLRVKCPTEFLCDNCKNDYRSACLRSQAAYPNATKCPDYEAR